MSATQHEGAHRLLGIIKKAWTEGRLLTYESAALELGRKEDHARTVAQMCDLLDAATVYARRPLIALIVIREKSGHINRKAWIKTPIQRRMKSKIIAYSQAWRFSTEDFKAIDEALTALAGYGNRAAWRKVRSEISSKEMYNAIASESIETARDAIDDLGSDTPAKRLRLGTVYARDNRVRKAVERRAGGCCEFCGKAGFLKSKGIRYIETHHIIALAKDGEDRMSNVIGLCAEHHREAHFGVRSKELELEMVALVGAVGDRKSR